MLSSGRPRIASKTCGMVSGANIVGNCVFLRRAETNYDIFSRFLANFESCEYFWEVCSKHDLAEFL